MFKANQTEAWDHTACISATILNVNRDPKKSEAVDPMSLNPYRKQPKKRELTPEEHAAEMALLRAQFENATQGRGS